MPSSGYAPWARRAASSTSTLPIREDRLTGIVSIRNLLVARDTEKITEVYAKGVVALPDDAPIPEAYRLFSQSRFLSLPVIDSQKKICGVVHAHELVNELGKETEASSRKESVASSSTCWVSRPRIAPKARH